ncbi:aminotransferase DegT [Acrocarpospora phusangensis]|uniref:Aminotransferase DegT n=1 Tax=Acrocarpospora phusangensis TaxID=1070424 RepID=A0A919UR85_9ACTN|nr:DegT/DnrJ/EryC1/StrS family aminotransferase [Acrocarpospora phusangensis]GIH25280.1 aminotransferase DegT [Acrocarpospora phusangensis]
MTTMAPSTAPSTATDGATTVRQRAWPRYDEESLARVAELARAGRTFDYHHGPELAEIEELFTRAHDGRYAVALNSGTSALLAAYHALGVGPGDEVLVPALTFLATASPLFLLGAVPVLCDAGTPQGNVSADTLRERVTPRTKAIAVTHLFGHPAPMAEIAALAREHGLPLIEDCSHAHGSTLDGRSVGTFGDLAVYSIGGLKLVSGGMGGVLLARDARHHDLACLLSSFQQRSAETVIDPRLRGLADVGLGGNLRITPIAAVLAASHARRLPELVAAKQRNARALLSRLTVHPGVEELPVAAGATTGGWYDVVFAVDEDSAGFTRDDLIAALQAHGLPAGVPRSAPLHLASVFRGEASPDVLRTPLGYRPGDLPVSESLHRQWVSLLGPQLNAPEPLVLDGYLAAADAALAGLTTSRGARR